MGYPSFDIINFHTLSVVLSAFCSLDAPSVLNECNFFISSNKELNLKSSLVVADSGVALSFKGKEKEFQNKLITQN